MTLVFVYCYDMSKRVSGSGGKTLDTLGNYKDFLYLMCNFSTGFDKKGSFQFIAPMRDHIKQNEEFLMQI